METCNCDNDDDIYGGDDGNGDKDDDIQGEDDDNSDIVDDIYGDDDDNSDNYDDIYGDDGHYRRGLCHQYEEWHLCQICLGSSSKIFNKKYLFWVFFRLQARVVVIRFH